MLIVIVTGIIVTVLKVIRLRNERLIPAGNFPSTLDGERPSDLR